jgi:outer membrane receptor protein involved in Fe transport
MHGVICALIFWTGTLRAEPGTEPLAFEIEAQNLAGALREFSIQSGMQLLYSPSDIRGFDSPGLHGTHDPLDALSQLLNDTGLEIRQTGEGVLTLVAAEQPIIGDPKDVPRFSGLQSRLEEVIVTAARREEFVSTLPMSVTVLSGRELSDAQFTDFVDAANWVPNVNVPGGGFLRPNYVVRGIPNNSVSGRSVDVLIDGATGSNIYYASNPAPLDFERIEVIRGSQGTLYGQNSIAGTIKYVSVRPRYGVREGDLKLSGWSTSSGDDSWSGSAVVNLPVGENIAARFGVSYEDHGGFIDGYSPDPVTRFPVELLEKDINHVERTAYRGAISWRASDRLEIYLTARSQTLVSPWSNLEIMLRDPPGGGKLTPFSTYLYTPPLFDWKHQPEADETMATLEVVYAFGRVSLTSETTYFEDENRTAYTSVQVFPGFTSELAYDGLQVQENTSQEFRLTSLGDHRLEWVAGAYWREESFHQSYVSDYVNSGFQLDSFQIVDRSQLSVYGSASYSLTERVTLDAGLRWFRDDLDRYRNYYYTFGGVDQPPTVLDASHRWDTNSPRLAARYSMSDEAFLYASATKGFRGGTINMLGADAPPALRSADPDTSWTYELGLKGRWLDGRMAGDLVLFYTDWEDIQVRVLEKLDGQTINIVVNGESANARGLEAQFSWIPADNLVLSLAGHLIDTELDSSVRGEQGPSASGIREGNELTYSPRWGITASADMTWPLDNGMEVYAGIYLLARDGSYSSLTNEPISKSPSYEQGNVRLGMRTGSWDFTVFARNVWDERGFVYQQGSFASDQAGYADSIYPRRVGLTVRYGF